MKSELQQKLLKEYPQFFDIGDKKIYTGEKPMKQEIQELLNQEEMVLPIQFGFECGDGWYMLLEQLLHSIEWHLDPEHSWPKKERIPLHIQQIKEKFGGLRFYYSGGDELIRGMVNFAESLSYHICEHCGSTNNVSQTEGWITTLCEDCIKLK
jgi:long-subunit acyl-CoA synthetase (AMP-forming)